MAKKKRSSRPSRKRLTIPPSSVSETVTNGCETSSVKGSLDAGKAAEAVEDASHGVEGESEKNMLQSDANKLENGERDKPVTAPDGEDFREVDKSEPTLGASPHIIPEQQQDINDDLNTHPATSESSREDDSAKMEQAANDQTHSETPSNADESCIGQTCSEPTSENRSKAASG